MSHLSYSQFISNDDEILSLVTNQHRKTKNFDKYIDQGLNLKNILVEIMLYYSLIYLNIDSYNSSHSQE